VAQSGRDRGTREVVLSTRVPSAQGEEEAREEMALG